MSFFLAFIMAYIVFDVINKYQNNNNSNNTRK